MTLLYVEGSLCMRTGEAGWGSVIAAQPPIYMSGALPGPFGGAVTLMELAAVQAAVAAAVRRGYVQGGQLRIAMRSTAPLAVLRWVFPEAPFHGVVEVKPPKRLGPAVKDCQYLYDLHDDVERFKLTVELQHTTASAETAHALESARFEMDRARTSHRRAAG